MKKVYIDTHPKRKEIINALIKGEMPQRDIAKKYGIARQTITNYMKNQFAERAAKAVLNREIQSGEDILKEIDKIMEKASKMYEACDEYLTDPKNPKKYFLGPHADEVEIVYEETDGDITTTKRDTLGNILGGMQGKTARSVRYKYADPRELLLKTANVMNKQLELIARIQGEIKEQVQVNVYNNPEFVQLQQIVIKATEKYPEVRDTIVDNLNKVAREAEGGKS